MSLIALPTTSSNRKWMIWLIAPAVALLAVAVLWLLAGRMRPGGVPGGDQFYRVTLMPLDVKIVKDGELQALNNIEIQSMVEGQTTIQTLVKEGATVRKGDVLITLDSANIRQRIEDTFLDIQKAEADLTNSRELREIQISKNAADLEAAEVALTLARLALEQYVAGSYPQQLANAKTDLAMAEINLSNQQEKLAQTRALAGKGFVTMTQVKDDELQVTNATNNRDKAKTALQVLTQYTHQMTLAERENAVSQAEQRLARVKRENAASLSQRNADVGAKEQALNVLRRRMERFQEQLAATTIRAPADGMVVYATSNDRNAQSSLQEGMQVRERQNLLRLPDTSTMKAVVRIPEAQVARLAEGQRALVQVPNMKDPIGATLTRISVLSDNSQRWWNPDLKEYPVDLVLDHTPPSLKPGMGALTTIFIERLQDVVAVRLTSIHSVGRTSFVFVRGSGPNPEPREVRIGATNETHAQILEGLRPGEDVKILEAGEGQILLERAGIRIQPATRPQDVPDAPENGPPNGAPFGPGQARPNGVAMPGSVNGESGNGAPDAAVAPRGDRPRPDRPRGEGQRRPPARQDGAAEPGGD